jgi:hypothetical protein
METARGQPPYCSLRAPVASLLPWPELDSWRTYSTSVAEIP